MQPRQGRDIEPQGVTPLERADESVLEDLFGRLRITREPVRGSVDGAAVPGEELLERVEIVRLDTTHQLGVGSGGARRRHAVR